MTVSPSLMTGALTCYGDVNDRRPPPILVLPGTGSDGSGKRSAKRLRRDRALGLYVEPPSCDGRLADIGSVRRACGSGTSRGAGRRITVAGISQGGLLARLALTHWPSLRTRVADVVTAAAPHRGAQAPPGGAASALPGVPAGNMAAGGGLKLHAGPQQRPRRDARKDRVHHRAVRDRRGSATAEWTGADLGTEGRRQHSHSDVCRGRATSHIGTAVDSVTIAALHDAVTHKGPARASRFPSDVCAHPYGSGLDEQRTSAFLAIAGELLRQGANSAPGSGPSRA